MVTLSEKQFDILFVESQSVEEAVFKYETLFGKNPLVMSFSPQIFFKIANVFWSKEQLVERYGPAMENFTSAPSEMFSDGHIEVLINFIKDTKVFDEAFNIRYGDLEGITVKSMEDFERSFLCLNLLHSNVEVFHNYININKEMAYNYIKFMDACIMKTMSLED